MVPGRCYWSRSRSGHSDVGQWTFRFDLELERKDFVSRPRQTHLLFRSVEDPIPVAVSGRDPQILGIDLAILESFARPGIDPHSIVNHPKPYGRFDLPASGETPHRK